MSPPSSSKQGPYRKPQADVYTVLLAIALAAILLGCLFVFLEVGDYPDKPPWSGGSAVSLKVAGPGRFGLGGGAVAAVSPAEFLL